MKSVEEQAIYNLANMEDQDDIYCFQPLNSLAFTPTPARILHKQRPKTVESKTNNPRKAISLTTKRSQLKKHLKVLEQIKTEHQTPKTSKKVLTSQSLYCVVPSPSQIKNNCFPSHPVRKMENQKFSSTRYSNFKENNQPTMSKINPQQLIREDIMKRFKLRESVRKSQKMTKIQNLLKMNHPVRNKQNAVPIFFRKKEEKFKVTLTNLLS